MIQTYSAKHPWNNNRGYKELGPLLILFLIWPFGAWLYSLYNANKKSSYVIFFMFSLLLCWHMTPYSGEYDDYIGILERFNYNYFTTHDIKTQINAYFAMDDDAPKELYENIMIWFIKGFTNNSHFYFLFCAIPVAYCQLKSLKRITQDVRYQPHTFMAIAIMVMFIFPRDIITVQNPRFTTGFWICILCTLNYICNKQKNLLYLIPVLLTPMIHSGMWLYVIIMGVYLFIPNNLRILEIAALCSIPFCFIDADIIKGIDFSILPDFLYRWSLSHFDNTSNIIEVDARAGFWWVGSSFAIASKIIYIYMFIMMVKNKQDVKNNLESQNLYPFLLFLLTIVNIIQAIPVLGERYYWFIKIFTIFVWFKAFYPQHKKVIICLLLANSWAFLQRYGYVLGGALSTNTPIDIFFTPLPYLIGKGLFW
ncbi:MAG: EpsG family protein [Lachnospiraceae bacterium]|nr:EpsG family protein [Lachnospiraceae bacterium]